MEKRKATYDLQAIKAVTGSVDTLSITTSARRGAARRDATALGYDRNGIVGVIQVIETRMFYKSMTTLADHRVWQDVNHVSIAGNPTLYVKFQANVVTEFTVMAFKEK